MAAIVLPLVISGTSLIGVATWYLSSAIYTGRTIDAAATAVVVARVAADEARIDALEKLDTEHYAEDLNSRNSLQAGLNSLIQSMADLRVSLAKVGRK